jgi:uncharacterized Zn-finger protein
MAFRMPVACWPCSLFRPYFKPVLRNGPYSRSSDGLYICKVCNKSFGDNFNLMIHNRIHTGERPHVCNECGKCFTQFSNLKIHSLVHTGERPHLCKECGRSFRRAAHLQKHALLHTGQRPHVCIVCSKTFVCLTDMKNHAFIHTMDRPHKCELCTKAFATPARLRRHQFTHKNSVWGEADVTEMCGSLLIEHAHSHVVLRHTWEHPGHFWPGEGSCKLVLIYLKFWV